jgi:hypothetical protein
LYQTAWVSIESALYKFNNEPGHPKIFNMWCCAPETLIQTNKGLEPIADVALGVKSNTLSIDGTTYNDVIAGMIRPKTNTLIISTKSSHIECSPEHKLLSSIDGYIDIRNASELQCGNLLARKENVETEIAWEPIESIISSINKVCEINVNSDDHLYISNGYISHNSQIARTAILAAIKKDNRDRKNSEGYRYHLDDKVIRRPAQLGRFLDEARDVCRYCDDFMCMIDTLENIYYSDSKPYEGLIGKLTRQSRISRARVVRFMKMLRLMSFEFTDSPIGAIEHQEQIIKPSLMRYIGVNTGNSIGNA